jgi:hypothetical protein
MLFLIVHPEWRNWQTRWTQKQTPATYSNLLIHIQDSSHFIRKGGSLSFNGVQVCSFLLIVRL